jgi:leader peptidase (prepilin peptidase)/N-methyltransferase
VIVLLAAGAGFVGLLIGSFVNVVAYRVPAGLSVVRPRSACPACGHVVRERDNVPVLSWLLLRGRCRDCAVPIPVRYPAVEAFTAVLFAAVATVEQRPAVLAACLVVAGAGVALAHIDLEHGRLPFGITAVAALLSVLLLGAGLVGDRVLGTPGLLGPSLLAPLVGAAVWLAVYGGLWLVTRGRGMGLGDVALAPLLGLVLGAVGVGTAVVGLGLGFLLGTVAAGVLATRGVRVRGMRLPFGPFMLGGAALALAIGEPLSAAYLRFTGLA